MAACGRAASDASGVGATDIGGWGRRWRCQGASQDTGEVQGGVPAGERAWVCTDDTSVVSRHKHRQRRSPRWGGCPQRYGAMWSADDTQATAASSWLDVYLNSCYMAIPARGGECLRNRSRHAGGRLQHTIQPTPVSNDWAGHSQLAAPVRTARCGPLPAQFFFFFSIFFVVPRGAPLSELGCRRRAREMDLRECACCCTVYTVVHWPPPLPTTTRPPPDVWICSALPPRRRRVRRGRRVVWLEAVVGDSPRAGWAGASGDFSGNRRCLPAAPSGFPQWENAVLALSPMGERGELARRPLASLSRHTPLGTCL